MATTTTKNIKRASTVLMPRIERTEKDMKRKMERAGCAEYKTVKVMIPKDLNENDDVLTVGYQGEMFYFLRGKSVNMPEPLVNLLTDCGAL